MIENIRSNSRPARGAIDKFALLRNHPLFRALRPPVIERLASCMKQRRIARGEIIFAKGDVDTGLMGVLAGSVKISVASLFGVLVDGQPHPADATAMSDCELVVIEHQDFMRFLRSEPDLGRQFIEILCARLRGTSKQVEDVTFLDLPTRLAKVVLRLSALVPTGKVAITQHEISQIIGRSRESTNKQLRAWAKHGWIRLERGGVSVLQPEKLAEVAAKGSDIEVMAI